MFYSGCYNRQLLFYKNHQNSEILETWDQGARKIALLWFLMSVLVGGCHIMFYLFEFFRGCREKLNKSLVVLKTAILSLQNLSLLSSHKLNHFSKDSIFKTLLSCFKMGVMIHPRQSHAGITKCTRASSLRKRNIDWSNGIGDRIPRAWGQHLVRALQLYHKIKRW